MQALKRILLPITDVVPFGRLVRRAVWLACHCDAHLVLLHVGSPTWDIDDQVPEGVKVTRLLRAGDPLHQIVTTARSHDIDLIMMAPHGKWCAGNEMQSESDFLSFARRSVIARVIEMARCPVWVDVGQGMPDDTVFKPLCYLNLQARSAGTLAQAGLFADALGVHLTVAHATYSTEIYAPGGASPTAGMWQESFAQTATEKFARLQHEVGTDADLVIENGDPLNVLPRLVAKTESDLLMVSHWAQGERWGRGDQWNDESDVFRIIHYSRVPVLIFKDGAQPRPRRDAFLDSRQRLVRDLVILLPMLAILVTMVILAIEKNRPSLIPVNNWLRTIQRG